jgi:MFS family permease
MATDPIESEMVAIGESKGNGNGNFNQVENVDGVHNLSYDDTEIEPEFHARTFIALGSMFILNAVIAIAVQGPPTILGYISQSLNAKQSSAWVPNALTLTQAVLGPIISLVSDTFQARKSILVYGCTISVIGCAIAPGAKSISRLIVAQVLIGVGFSSQALAYSIPSEILPRKWRPRHPSL